MIINIKIGRTYFRNTEFIYVSLEDILKAEYIFAHPPQLGHLLKNCEIDIAPVSSIFYDESFYIFPDFCISADGSTKSILIFSNKVKRLDEVKKLATPYNSASSVALAQILFKTTGIKAKIIKNMEPRLDKMLRVADAALLIGDDALIASRKFDPIADLGELWKEITGKKMVYALWLINKKVYTKKREKEFKILHQSFKKALEYSYRNFSKTVEAISNGIDISLLSDHIKRIDYKLDNRALEGFKEYLKLAEEAGIKSDVPKVKILKL